MKPANNIDKWIKNTKIKTNPEADKVVISDFLYRISPRERTSSTYENFLPWRFIMNSNIAKVAIVIAILVILFAGIHQYGHSEAVGADMAWGEIVKNMADINYLHYYNVENYEDGFPSIREGWYSAGKLKTRTCGGYSSYGAFQSFDDGVTWKVYDRHNNVTCIAKSGLMEFGNIFEALTGGDVTFDYKSFQNKTPSLVGEDFLIYDFDPPADADWIDKISVTVGRNSLIPIQIKKYYKIEQWQWYSMSSLLLFDYEEPPKSPDFFDPPTVIKPPHGVGRLVLGGDPVEIELHDAPGVAKAVVQLHTKFDGPAEELLISYRERYGIIGGPMYFMSIYFITDEGHQSITSEKCPLWINQGVKAALGNKRNWPDGKDRNIRYTPVLRTTDKTDEFILELSCWMRIKPEL